MPIFYRVGSVLGGPAKKSPDMPGAREEDHFFAQDNPGKFQVDDDFVSSAVNPKKGRKSEIPLGST